MSDQPDAETSPLSLLSPKYSLFAPLKTVAKKLIGTKKNRRGIGPGCKPSPPSKLSLWLLYCLTLKAKKLRYLEKPVTTSNHGVTSQKI